MIVQIIGWVAIFLAIFGFIAWAFSYDGFSEEFKQRRLLVLISVALFLICAAICFK